MDLPIFLLLTGFLLAIACLCYLLRKRLNGKWLRWYAAVALLLFIALLADHKISSTLREVRQARMSAMIDRGDGLFAQYNSHYDRKQAEKSLLASLGPCEIREYPQHPAVDFALIRREQPLTHIYLAIVDLTHPYIGIVLDDTLGEKYLTSSFAEKNKCLLAINGEAGLNPALNSGFGPWVGNYIWRGKPLMMEDNAQRPFIGFTPHNRASYYPAPVVDTTLDSGKYNAVYGRFDILLDGKNLGVEPGWGQPRTLMGIDREGKKLFLMVVDGRQPGYSMGMGLKEAADVLLAFGAWSAMSCDQGGSSCIYLSSRHGIVSRPSDDGRERPTYTHFGIRIEREKY